ncbi:hypothetical protein AGMMS49992_17020 [Clostridia bacterium]|nr:hypothetical protein AGMMS49992_17020 [Clostridia bacterium]
MNVDTAHDSHEVWRTLARVPTHPLSAFYDVRHRGMGSVPIALALVAMFSICYTLNRLFSSFVVNVTDPRSIDMLMELGGVYVLFLLFCVGNWSVTCLMNGEGRFRDIVTVTGYALIPACAALIVCTILSRALASGEETFYYVILIAGIGWTAILVMIGIMTVHNYSGGKMFVTLILTVLVMFVVIFVALLGIDLLRQFIVFMRGIYTEWVFRR